MIIQPLFEFCSTPIPDSIHLAREPRRRARPCWRYPARSPSEWPCSSWARCRSEHPARQRPPQQVPRPWAWQFQIVAKIPKWQISGLRACFLAVTPIDRRRITGNPMPAAGELDESGRQRLPTSSRSAPSNIRIKCVSWHDALKQANYGYTTIDSYVETRESHTQSFGA